MRLSPARLASRTLLACALAAGLAVPAQQVAAQQIAFSTSAGFGGMGGDGMTAGLGKSDTELMAKLLNFTEDQKTATGILLDAYLADHAKRAEPIRAAQESARAAFREDQDFSVFADLAPKQEAFEKENAAKQRELIENVKGVLTTDQAAQWPLWERAHRRANSMNRGMLAGERADLIQIVDRLKFSSVATTALTPTLDAYALELDRAIVVRDEAQNTAAEEGKAMRDQFTKGGGLGSVDFTEMMKKAEEMRKKGREASVPVRDINRKFAKQIETTLGGVNADDARKFAAEFRKVSYPEVYKERFADRVLAAAALMEGLEKSQLEGIAAIKDQYLRDRAPMEQAAEKAADDAEANFSLTGMMGGGGGFMRMMGGDDATKAARKARRELDDSVIDKVKAMLTPDQAARLPDRSADTANDSPFSVMGMPAGGGGVRIRTGTP